jgi:hypothetical protein
MGFVYLMVLLISFLFELFIISSDLSNIGPLFVRQWRSAGYSQAPGKILQCQISSQTNSDRTVVYRAIKIKYEFDVGGHEWEAGRCSYFDGHQHPVGHDLTGETASQYSEGSAVKVYYNPNDPGDALLFPGPGGDEIVLHVYKDMLSLYLISVFWVVCLPGFLRSVLKPLAGGVKIIRKTRLVQAPLPWFNPAIIAIASGLLTLALFGTLLNGRQASVFMACTGLLASILAVVLAHLWIGGVIRSGKYNLEIDKNSGTLTLPKTFFCRDRQVVRISEISEVTTKAFVVSSGKGNQCFFAPTLELRDHDCKPIAIVKWPERGRAESFTTWLRSELGISD